MSDLPLAREYLMQRRRALIIELDAIEDALEIHPRNSVLRREAKEEEKLKKCTCPPDSLGHSYDCPELGNRLARLGNIQER